LAEDLSERWDNNDGSYRVFTAGIREFERRWKSLCEKGGDVSNELLALFGEPVKAAFIKQARRMQEARRNSKLGVTSTGTITAASSAAHIVRQNTFYGED
jgi:hypothetical protein